MNRCESKNDDDSYSNKISDINILSETDLDKFQNQIESKFRQPFTSFDFLSSTTSSSSSSSSSTSSLSSSSLSLSIASLLPSCSENGSGSTSASASTNTNTNISYIQCLSQIFPKLMKPIKLRVLISMLAFLKEYYDQVDKRARLRQQHGNTGSGNGDVAYIHDNENDTDTESESESDLKVLKEIKAFLEHVLETTTKSEKWIKIMSTVVLLHFRSVLDSVGSTGNDDHSDSADNGNGNGNVNNKKETPVPQMDSAFNKGIMKIINTIESNSLHATNLRAEAENKFMPSDNDTTTTTTTTANNESKVTNAKDVTEKESKMETFIDSFQIGTDVQPYYTPYHYKLCSSQIILHHSISSELVDQCDFTMKPAVLAAAAAASSNNGTSSNGKSKINILQMDEINDRQKALEEMKEIEIKNSINERKKNMAVNMRMRTTNRTNNMNRTTGAGVRPGGSGTSSNGGAATTNAGGGTNSNTKKFDMAALMMRRTKIKGGTAGTAAGGGASKAGALSANAKLKQLQQQQQQQSKQKSSLVTGNRVRKAGFGRGAAANSIGGKSLTIPSSGLGMAKGRNLGISSKSNMAGRTLLRNRKKATSLLGGNSGTGSNGASGGGASGSSGGGASAEKSNTAGSNNSRGNTKMKMIDVNEVKGLKQEGEQRQLKFMEAETKESRKRKIMERAASRGLTTKKKWGANNKNAAAANGNGNGDADGNVKKLSTTKADADAADALKNGAGKDNGASNDTNQQSQEQPATKRVKVDEDINASSQEQNYAQQVAQPHHNQQLLQQQQLQQQQPLLTSQQMAYLNQQDILQQQQLQQQQLQQQQLQQQQLQQQQLQLQQIQQQQLQQQMQQDPFFMLSPNNNHSRNYINNNLSFSSNDLNASINEFNPPIVQNSHLHLNNQQYQLQQLPQTIVQPPPSSSLSSFGAATQLSQLQKQKQHHQQQQQQRQQQMMDEMQKQNENSWQQLLEKSNKLSAEDRDRVTQFFTNRSNPTPAIKVYKTKLHEEKFTDPETQQTVKETYYIELDYDTFGYKKVRKIKKK